jgi:hypothetical protein
MCVQRRTDCYLPSLFISRVQPTASASLEQRRTTGREERTATAPEPRGSGGAFMALDAGPGEDVLATAPPCTETGQRLKPC